MLILAGMSGVGKSVLGVELVGGPMYRGEERRGGTEGEEGGNRLNELEEKLFQRTRCRFIAMSTLDPMCCH